MSTQIPSRIVGGRYRLVAPLGRGGMGTVWSAVDETLGRHVALKEVTPPPELDAEQRAQLRERTLREARAAARIDSPAAVTVYDVVEEDGRPWIVMQLLRARTLADVIRQDGPLPDREVARIGLRVLEALEAAHRAGVLHRDVKPANVLIPDSGGAVLSDFGIASLEGDASMTTTGMLIGSPAYMAPERARGVPPSPASDLWSLGATLSTALRGRSPFERDGQIPTLLAVMHDDPAAPPVDGPLAEAIAGLLRKDPAERLRAPAVAGLLSRAAHATPTFPGGPPVASRRQLDRTQPVPVIPDTPLVAFSAPPSAVRPTAAPPVAAPVAAPVAPPLAAPVAAPVEPALVRIDPAQRRVPPEPPAADGWPATTADRQPRRAVVGVLVALLLFAAAAAAFALWPRHHADPAADPATSGAPATPTAGGATGSSAGPASGAGSATTSRSPSVAASATPPSASSTPSVSGGAATSPTSAATDGPVGGFTSYTANPAYRIDVPTGWVRDVQTPRTYFRQPAGDSYLEVERGGVPNGDPLPDSRYIESQFTKSHGGYHRIQLHRVPYKNFNAVDWEFTWTTSNGQVLHVVDRNIVNGNHAYAVYWSVPDAQWAASQPALQHIFASFTPTE